MLRTRRVSSAELVEEGLRRIDPALNAFITVMADSAREAARTADRELAVGRDRGPLHGIPIALKDLIETRGVRTTAGSPIFGDHIPERDAAVVERLAEAGAIVLGKTNLHELAYGVTSNNPHFGPVLNPRDRRRVAGGSSGGSAVAVVTEVVFAALGTDTGGSIRIPAAFCGCVGFKPTFGLVSTEGVLPLSLSQDHVGPLARTVEDCGLVFEAISGPLPPPPASPPRIGAVELPDLDEINEIGRIILLAEAYQIYARHLEAGATFGADVRALLEEGSRVSTADLKAARRARLRKQAEFRRLWRDVDILRLPTTEMAAPLLDDPAFSRLAATRFTRPFDVLGLPALSVPCGTDPSGMPLGLQLVAAESDDARLLSAAAAFTDLSHNS